MFGFYNKLRYSFALIFCFYAAMAQEEVNPYKKLTKQFIGAVKRNEPYKNYRFFDTSVYGRMLESQTENMVEKFIKKNGPIVAIEKTEVDTQGCKMATATAIKTKNGKFLWYHYYDQSYYIQRFEIDTFTKEKWFYEPEVLDKTNHYRKDILIRTNAFIQLPGTLFLPLEKKKCPLVILVHGSGPHDRNATIGKNKIFFDIAINLAQQGIAVLAYDKRTYVYQYRDPFPLDSMDYYSETIDDAVAAFELAKSFTEVDTNRIYIAGHSLGGMLAPLIAGKCKNLKGLILLAAPARGILEILPEQLDYIHSITPEDKKEESEKMINAVKWQVKNALKPDLTLKSKVMLPFGGKPKYWLMDRNYKVLEEAKKLKIPMLLIQGGRDYNVTKKDYDMWINAMQGKSNFKSVWFENLDHLFFEGTGTAKPEDLKQAKHVSKVIYRDIVAFIGK